MPGPPNDGVEFVEDFDTNQIVKTTIQKASRIATLPAVTVRIIQLCEDPETAVGELSQAIDPVLAVKILKLVNSAFYGVPSRIESLKHAVMMLGLNAVKNIAIAASLVRMVRGGNVSSDFKASDLWTHSIAVATGAQMLARQSFLGSSDEAFLAGLIHDIGIIIEMQVYRERFGLMIDNLATDESLTFRTAEEQEFGATHEAFGAGLCEEWHFPASLKYSTGHHHRPWELEERHRRLPALVHVADVLAARTELGYTRTVETDTVAPEILSYLNLTEVDLDMIAEDLPEATLESQRLLSDDN